MATQTAINHVLSTSKRSDESTPPPGEYRTVSDMRSERARQCEARLLTLAVARQYLLYCGNDALLLGDGQLRIERQRENPPAGILGLRKPALILRERPAIVGFSREVAAFICSPCSYSVSSVPLWLVRKSFLAPGHEPILLGIGANLTATKLAAGNCGLSTIDCSDFLLDRR
jgi:hypothetical protein